MANAPSPRHPRDLTDEQWALVGPFLPTPPRRPDGRGRPWRANRPVLNGILWVLRTGAPWADLPNRYPSYQTCHRRFQHWVRAGLLRTILEVLAQALHDEGYLDLQEAFIDGSIGLTLVQNLVAGVFRRFPQLAHPRGPILPIDQRDHARRACDWHPTLADAKG